MRDRLMKIVSNALDRTCGVSSCAANIETNDSGCLGCLVDELLANDVIAPPCKVGDKLYTTYCYGINDWRIEESVVYEISQRMGTGLEIIERRRNQNGTFSYFKVELDKFGKTVFLTREEAEQALRKEDKEK